MSDQTDQGQPEEPGQQPAWGAPTPPYGGQPPAYGDPLGDPYSLSGEQEVLDGAKPRSRRGVVVGLAAVLGVGVAAAGVYLTGQLSGGGLQPEALAPRSTFAFVKLDLDPAAGQKLAIREFFGHFPGAPKGTGDQILRRFVAAALAPAEDVDFDKDVDPWLGDRIGLAVYGMSSDGPQTVGIVQTKDEAEARAGLARIDAKNAKETDDFSYTLHRGYAIVGADQATVDQAARQSDGESFEANEQYGKDVDVLSGDQVITAWADVDAAMKALRQSVPELGAIPSGLLGNGGRLVLGGHAAGDYAELEGYGLGNTENLDALRNGKPTLLAGLPSGTLAAVSVNDLGVQVDKVFDQFATLGIDPMMFLGPFEEETGISVREDIVPLFGKQAVLALGSFPTDPSTTRAGLVSEVGDTAKALAVGRKLAALAEQFGMTLRSEAKGDTFYLALGQGYLEELSKGGDLGSTPGFRKAMGDLGDDVAVATYVNLAAIVDALPVAVIDAEENLKALRAFGASAGRQGDRGYFRMRLAVR